MMKTGKVVIEVKDGRPVGIDAEDFDIYEVAAYLGIAFASAVIQNSDEDPVDTLRNLLE